MWQCEFCKKNNFSNSLCCSNCGCPRTQSNGSVKRVGGFVRAAVTVSVIVAFLAMAFLIYTVFFWPAPTGTNGTGQNATLPTEAPASDPVSSAAPINGDDFTLPETLAPENSGGAAANTEETAETVEQATEGIGSFTGVMGTSFYVPGGFEQYNPGPVNGYMYCFYNTELEMEIKVSEIAFSAIDSTISPKSLIASDYSYFKRVYGDSVTYSNSKNYTLSGYSDENTIFYMCLYNFDPAYVMVEFRYPVSTREICDVLLVDFLSSIVNENGYGQEYTSAGPGPDDLLGCSENVQYPSGTWLNDYEFKYLKTRHGVRAYLKYRPEDAEGTPQEGVDFFAYVYEGAAVTVLARENGYSLVKTNDGTAGWVGSSLLVDSYY